MNALDILFIINKIEGKLTRDLIAYREELLKVHGLIRVYTWMESGLKTSEAKSLHQRVKDQRRAISELLQVSRMDKKYG